MSRRRPSASKIREAIKASDGVLEELAAINLPPALHAEIMETLASLDALKAALAEAEIDLAP